LFEQAQYLLKTGELRRADAAAANRGARSSAPAANASRERHAEDLLT